MRREDGVNASSGDDAGATSSAAGGDGECWLAAVGLAGCERFRRPRLLVEPAAAVEAAVRMRLEPPATVAAASAMAVVFAVATLSPGRP